METTIGERRTIFIHAPNTQEPMCANCAYYHPHYRRDGYSFGCGHCVYPRMKQRRAYDLCDHFNHKEDNRCK